MEAIEGFERHVVLYAKNWYKHTKDPIRDLKKLLAHYAGIEVNDIRANTIYEYLATTFLKTMNHKACSSVYGQAIAEMLGKKWGGRSGIPNRKPVYVLLGNISICDGIHANLDLIFKEFAIDDLDKKLAFFKKP